MSKGVKEKSGTEEGAGVNKEGTKGGWGTQRGEVKGGDTGGDGGGRDAPKDRKESSRGKGDRLRH